MVPKYDIISQYLICCFCLEGILKLCMEWIKDLKCDVYSQEDCYDYYDWCQVVFSFGWRYSLFAN